MRFAYGDADPDSILPRLEVGSKVEASGFRLVLLRLLVVSSFSSDLLMVS